MAGPLARIARHPPQPTAPTISQQRGAKSSLVRWGILKRRAHHGAPQAFSRTVGGLPPFVSETVTEGAILQCAHLTSASQRFAPEDQIAPYLCVLESRNVLMESLWASTWSEPRPCVQQRAGRHGNRSVRGNVGNVESATYRIQRILLGSNPTLSANLR